MSLLSSFVANHLIKGLEAELVSHAPEMQQFILNELQAASGAVLGWVQSKLESKSDEQAS